ncbi:MAG: porin [Acidithiobacillus sp.]
MRKLRAAVCCTLGIAVMTVAQSASAANWFELQGISPALAPLVTVSGYLQPTYTYMRGTAVTNGLGSQVPHLNQIAPNFTSSNSFNINRARLMIRGNINRDISYFLAGEFGNNGFTHVGGNYTPAIIDGHVTFSHYIPGVRIEAGIIRAPGPEQAMQGYMAYNFTSFANVTTQMMLQPFYKPNPSTPYGNPNPQGGVAVPGQYGEGVNAFRYTGLEATNWFRNGPWEFTYGAMVGNFGPLTATNYSNSPLIAVRLQESYIFGGHGPFQSSLTGFIWYQHATPNFNGHAYSMTRDGIGIAYMQGYMHQWGRWAKVEYMRGSGMISTGSVFSSPVTVAPAAQQAALSEAQVYPGSQNTARGYYISGGLFVTRRAEVDLRYDHYNRLPNIATQNRTFNTWAVGLQYHFTPLTRVILDYYVRNVGIPHLGAIPPAQRALPESVANSADNALELQAVIAF